MNNIAKVLNNLRSLRTMAKDLSLEELKSMLEKLTLVVKEKHQEAEAQQLAQKERLARLEKYRALLKEQGITPEELAELLDSTSEQNKKRAPRPPKYQYTVNGQVKTWTGQGRTPLALQAELDAGKTLADFEI
ncbi:H-NS family nucleoid-associated regulatory protein [Conservatibacter flavescens]|uniref:DNA-binding protein n=1 Tax=Conservatibacter flavescens TaxID=28161 RepID=A0A2M8S5F3_9PAST|nr:H-NS family nucleoid-associated regulatory protein [Conservatibacter flavescens]PJG86370.1 DNA-binding protein H-NS-like protein [Conservatibacter flavescens]